MVDESVVGLSPIATAILEAVPEVGTTSLQAVADQVVATFGPPEGPETALDIIRQQVWDLVSHNVLKVVDDKTAGDHAAASFVHTEQHPTDVEHEAAVRALRDALRHLRSDIPGRWPSPAELSPRAFTRAAGRHHVVPYLAAHLDRLELPAEAKSGLLALAGRQRAGAAELATDLAAAIRALDAVGIRALAFKGLALGVQAHGDYAIRGAGDLDLLVSPHDLDRAHQTLDQAGWRPAPGYPVPGPTWAWRHFVRTSNELSLRGARSEIDLHWHLVPTRGTFPEFDTLWGRRDVVSVAGHPIPTLAPFDALAHSAAHATRDQGRWLRSLVDVHALMSLGETWLIVDRPLRTDQLLSVGVAAHDFGRTSNVPPVVDAAMRLADHDLLERIHDAQVAASPHHRALSLPGHNFLRRLRGIRETNGVPREALRLLSRSAMPPWTTADLSSASAFQAVPRAIGNRVKEVIGELTRGR